MATGVSLVMTTGKSPNPDKMNMNAKASSVVGMVPSTETGSIMSPYLSEYILFGTDA